MLRLPGRLAAAAALPVLVAVHGSLAQDGVSDSQYWHERYHGILSMAAYGDYATLCPQQTFTQAALQKSFPNSVEAPWTLLQAWGPTVSGSEGFIATIPEMDKVVMVFKGQIGWEAQFNMSSIPVGDIFYLDCDNCQAHAGAVQAYLEAKEATGDWQVVKDVVNQTGHQWSITGHGFGGMVAQVASLDLGWRGLAHWTHNHGSPRVFNQASADLVNKLYAGEAGQRVVANNDSWPEYIPASEDYVHAFQGFHIFGTNSTYGMNYVVCNDPADPECLGGDVETDTWYYYNEVGQCGGYGDYNSTELVQTEAALSSSFYGTATISPPNSTTALSTTSLSSTSTSISATTTSSVEGIAQAAAATPLPSTTPTSASAKAASISLASFVLLVGLLAVQ